MTKNERTRAWYQANKEHALAYAKAYRERLGKDKIRENNLAYRIKHPDKMKKAQDTWKAKNKDRVKANLERWVKENPDRKRAHRRAADLRHRNKPEFKIKKSIHKATQRMTKYTGRQTNATKLLGAPIPEVRTHIEKQFKPDMTWENHGKVWHIDHINPLCAFDLNDPQQLALAGHYTNLRPLYWRDNLMKATKERRRVPSTMMPHTANPCHATALHPPQAH